ncbi:MAG: AAA family ATPase [Caldisericaceae bacterium]|nr:AAA family ATPase [Caldisericaceae bacterium]
MKTNEERRKRIFDAANKIKEQAKEGGRGFRVVITGKGGAGKTTTTAMLSHLFARKGYNVLAVDEDPQMNLPYAIGIPREEGDKIVPVTKNLDYIEEKTGARPGEGWGLMLTLNPDVSDVVERFGIKGPDGINMLVMGTVVQAATGCLCPENALLEAIVRYINLRNNEIILMDTQAGVEHFGRALAQGFRHVVIVTDATFNSVQVAKHAAKLAKDINIPHLYLLINRVRSNDSKELEKVKQIMKDEMDIFDEVFELPYEEKLFEYEPNVMPLLDVKPSLGIVEKMNELMEALEKYDKQ